MRQTKKIKEHSQQDSAQKKRKAEKLVDNIENTIKFLEQLQKEMLTQDKVSQADPRFWVVQGTVRDFGFAEGYADGSVMVIDCETTIDTVEEAYKFLTKDDSYTFSYDGEMDSINVCDTDGEEVCDLYTLEDICDFINENDIEDLADGGYPYISNYKNVPKIFKDTFFLTNRECKEHIARNYYHYPKDAHSFAMTAWRSPQVEELYKIIQETDWNSLRGANNKKG